VVVPLLILLKLISITVSTYNIDRSSVCKKVRSKISMDIIGC
jgi:hypothetical protein